MAATDQHPSSRTTPGTAARPAVRAGNADGTPSAGPSAARARRRFAVPVVALLAAGLLGLAGCGGGGGDDERDADDGSKLTAADARIADQAAKRGAREVAVAVESCFVGAGDYGRCRRRDQIGVTELVVVPSSPGVSEATVSRATPTGYRVLAVSLSGNRFAITKRDGTVIRSCAARTPLGKAGGGCPGNGW